MSSPAAYFDTLSLGERMSDLVEGFSRPELHLFTYAACLLSLYEGQPTADWEYEFASTDNGLPFSREVDESIDTGIGLGLLHGHGSLLVITKEGRYELDVLRQMEGNKARERYLAGAADALLVFNPGNIREAFNYDPAISYLKKGNRTDWLLTAPVVERLYGNFHQLRTALAYDARDLSVPLVSWLQYLIQTGRSELHDRRAG
jgi:hypothetical protein